MPYVAFHGFTSKLSEVDTLINKSLYLSASLFLYFFSSPCLPLLLPYIAYFAHFLSSFLSPILSFF